MESARFDPQKERIAIALERIANALATNNDATAKAAKATTTSKRFAPTDIIRLTELTKSLGGNPKQPGKHAWYLFELYKGGGITVADYVEAVGAQEHRPYAAYEALRWDVDHGYITVGK